MCVCVREYKCVFVNVDSFTRVCDYVYLQDTYSRLYAYMHILYVYIIV